MADADTTPALPEPSPDDDISPASSTPSLTISEADVTTAADTAASPPTNPFRRSRELHRPPMASRKSSGSLIIPASHPNPQAAPDEEVYPADDARAMSPRRNSDEIERMGDDARLALREQARALQESLLEIVERVAVVKGEWERLEGRGRFLQSYIGELMQTSKITAAGGMGSAGGKGGAKGRGRAGK